MLKRIERLTGLANLTGFILTMAIREQHDGKTPIPSRSRFNVSPNAVVGNGIIRFWLREDNRFLTFLSLANNYNNF